MIDLTGKQFDKLTVIKQVGKDKWGNYKWLCRCKCKNRIIVRGYDLKRGNTKSCGCLAKTNALKHGHSQNDKTYISWCDMIQRCTNPNHKSYKNYGGRGIIVCDEWLHSFPNFLRDMPGWKPGLQIERRNNDKKYSPKNCYWATRKQQQRNRRNNLYVTCFGKTQLLIEWSEEIGIPYNTLYTRIYTYGWTVEKALTTPVRKKRKIDISNR